MNLLTLSTYVADQSRAAADKRQSDDDIAMRRYTDGAVQVDSNVGGDVVTGTKIETGGGDFTGRDRVPSEAQPHRESPPAPAVDLPALRARLQRLDAVDIESLCLDHCPAVYDKFTRGLQRGEMINLLLDHCRRNPEAAARLAQLLP